MAHTEKVRERGPDGGFTASHESCERNDHGLEEGQVNGLAGVFPFNGEEFRGLAGLLDRLLFGIRLDEVDIHVNDFFRRDFGLFRRSLVLREVERFSEFYGLEVIGMALLPLCGKSLFRDKGFCIKGFAFPVGVFSAKGQKDLRVEVVRDVHQAGALRVGDEGKGSIVALCKAETLDIEGLGTTVPVEYGIGFPGIQLFNPDNVALILVDEVVIRRIEGTVGEDGENPVFTGEFADKVASAVLVEALDVRVVPYVLSAKGSYSLGFEDNLLDGILRNEVAAGSLSLD